MMDEVQLIKQALGGNLGAFEIIVKHYQKKIYIHSFRILKDHHAAEDATQETFIKVYKNLKHFNQELTLSPWLYKIATNFCIDYLRKRKKLVRLDMEIEYPDCPKIDQMIEVEEKKNIISALFNLPKIYFEPIYHYYFLGLTYKSMAQIFSLPVNTVRTRLRRGKMQLLRNLR